MEYTGSPQSALICLMLAATVGLSLLLLQPAKSELWLQAKVEQRLAGILAMILVLLGGILMLFR
jgi:hypothetical protein